MVDSAEKILNIISVLKKFSPTDKDMGYLEKLYDRQHRSGGGGGRGDGGSRRGGGRVSKFQQPKSRPIHKPVSKTKGQGRNKQAMKIVNMVKLKEEFDFESLCWKLEGQVDHLSAEIEREQKLREHGKCDLEKGLKQCQVALADARKSQVTRHEFLKKENIPLQLEMKGILNELEKQKGHNNLLSDKVVQLEMSLQRSQLKEMGNQAYQEALADTTQLYEKKTAGLMKQFEDEHARCEGAEVQLDLANKLFTDQQNSMQKLKEIDELRMELQEMYHQHEVTLTELQSPKAEHENLLQEKEPSATDFVLQVLNGLPEEYDSMVNPFLAQCPLASFEEIRSDLLGFESRVFRPKSTTSPASKLTVTASASVPLCKHVSGRSRGRGWYPSLPRANSQYSHGRGHAPFPGGRASVGFSDGHGHSFSSSWSPNPIWPMPILTPVQPLA